MIDLFQGVRGAGPGGSGDLGAGVGGEAHGAAEGGPEGLVVGHERAAGAGGPALGLRRGRAEAEARGDETGAPEARGALALELAGAPLALVEEELEGGGGEGAGGRGGGGGGEAADVQAVRADGLRAREGLVGVEHDRSALGAPATASEEEVVLEGSPSRHCGRHFAECEGCGHL